MTPAPSPRIENIQRLTTACIRHGKIEFQIALAPNACNPYRSAEIALDAVLALPSGKTMVAPCFYALDSSQPSTVANSGLWHLRFSTPECGEHRVRFVLKSDGRMTSETDAATITVTDSDLPGRVRISDRSPHYLQFDNGQPYFAIGQNLCFLTERAKRIPIFPDCGVYSPLTAPDLPWDVAYRRWMTRMAENGANWVRLWMRPTFYLENDEPWQFNHEHARRLDLVLELAETLGLYVCLCLEDIRDFFHPIEGVSTANWFSGYDTAWRRLLESQGCHRTDDFFTCPAALELMRDKLRYVIARWGFSNHIFAWELWNEIQCVGADGDRISSWVREMTQTIRATDPHRHLVKSPYNCTDGERLTTAHGDLNDAHPYFGWSGVEETKDFAAFIYHHVLPIKTQKQPFMVGEAGLAREVQTPYGLTADLADRDTACVNVHEALWGGLFSGSCGTGMVWWWDAHVGRHDCYWRFRGIANFTRAVAFHTESFDVRAVSVSNPSLRGRELRGKTISLLWIQHLWFTWWDVIYKKQIDPVRHAAVTLEQLEDGPYRTECWDTEKGTIIAVIDGLAVAGTLTLALPLIRTDLALKVVRGH